MRDIICSPMPFSARQRYSPSSSFETLRKLRLTPLGNTFARSLSFTHVMFGSGLLSFTTQFIVTFSPFTADSSWGKFVSSDGESEEKMKISFVESTGCDQNYGPSPCPGWRFFIRHEEIFFFSFHKWVSLPCKPHWLVRIMLFYQQQCFFKSSKMVSFCHNKCILKESRCTYIARSGLSYQKWVLDQFHFQPHRNNSLNLILKYWKMSNVLH